MPGTVAAVVATVMVVLPEVVTEVGLNDAVTPAGMPLTEKFTAPVNPFNGATATLYAVPCPRTTVWLAGEAESVKSAVCT